jgi:hypothetical protein
MVDLKRYCTKRAFFSRFTGPVTVIITSIQLFSQKKPKVVQRWVDFILLTKINLRNVFLLHK